MVNPVSPLTKKNNTAVIDTFLAKDIITLYKEQLDIDVSRFFKNNERFYLYRDQETGYKFYYPEGLDGDGKFYEDLQSKLGKDYYHTWKFENQLAYDEIKPGDKVLDIGCGTGNFLLRAAEKTKEVYGLELNEKAANECTKKGLLVFTELIGDHSQMNENKYDVVCMFQVLEHIYDVKEFLEASLKTLKKGGKIIIGVPNSDPYFLGYDKYCTLNLPPHHMGLWNKKVFEKISNEFNLKLVKTQYDTKGRLMAEAYLRAKYLAGVKSLPSKHSVKEKMVISMFAVGALPLTLIKKFTTGLKGSHIAVVFEKLY